MIELFFNDGAGIFTTAAAVGTIFFLLRLMMMLVGLGHDLAVDVDHGGMGDAHHGDSSDAFKVLSIQSIAAFVMGLGWGALAAFRSMEWSWTASLGFGIVCGLAMMYLLGLLLKAVYDLQSSGNVSIDDAAGREGVVYSQIPPRGQGFGQVKVVINDRQRIFNAVSSDEPIPTSQAVRIVRVNADHTLTVAPVA